MELIPWAWFVFAAVINIALIAFGIWLAWVLVMSVRGMHEELGRIRRLLERSGGSPAP